MTTRHLESSALAQAGREGRLVLQPDDIEAMMSSRDIGQEHVAAPEDAVRHLLAAIVADEPYLITHGECREAYEERLAAIEAALRSDGTAARRSEPRYSSKSRRRRRSSSVLMRQSPSTFSYVSW